jgi:hypothetical protein
MMPIPFMNPDERIPIDAYLVPRHDIEFRIMIINLCEPHQYGTVGTYLTARRNNRQISLPIHSARHSECDGHDPRDGMSNCWLSVVAIDARGDDPA